jgi:hypothetical protein
MCFPKAVSYGPCQRGRGAICTKLYGTKMHLSCGIKINDLKNRRTSEFAPTKGGGGRGRGRESKPCEKNLVYTRMLVICLI